MSNLLEFFSLHSIDIKKESPAERMIVGDTSDVIKYVEYVVAEVTKPPKGQTLIKGQYFAFISMEERVIKNLQAMCKDGNLWKEKATDNAEKLHHVEIGAQAQIERMGKNIRKGGLLQVKFTDGDHVQIILVKVDDNTFLDDEVMQIKTGLPLETRMQKVAIVKLKKDGTFVSLLLSDTNASISKYWSEDFFQAKPLRDEKTNTVNAFNAIDGLLKKKIKPKSMQDYYFIRNQIITEFRKESLNFNNLVDSLKEYVPVNQDIKEVFDDFYKALEALPTKDIKKSFDTQFDLDPKIINARLNNKIMIDDNFELRVLGDVDDLRTKLGSGSDDMGKFVKIYSDAGYDLFKRKLESTNSPEHQ